MVDLNKETNWESSWVNKKTGWDAGEGNAGFLKVLKTPTKAFTLEGKNLKNGIVPGCGTGYDVESMTFIKGLENAIGIDIAPTAAKIANNYLAQKKRANPDPNSATPVVEVHDYYGDEILERFKKIGGVDLIFDYTFLCAIPLKLRKESWAKRHTELLSLSKNKHRYLFVQVFPLTPILPVTPPHPVDLDEVKQLLSPYPYKLVYLDEKPPVAQDERAGFEVTAVFELQHTEDEA